MNNPNMKFSPSGRWHYSLEGLTVWKFMTKNVQLQYKLKRQFFKMYINQRYNNKDMDTLHAINAKEGKLDYLFTWKSPMGVQGKLLKPTLLQNKTFRNSCFSQNKKLYRIIIH